MLDNAISTKILFAGSNFLAEIPMWIYILNYTSIAKSNRSFNSTHIVSSIVTQFYKKLKHLFMKLKAKLHWSVIPF